MIQSSLRILSTARIWAWANMTIPNIITLSGIYMTWKMVILRLDGQAGLLTFCLLVGAVSTDKLDGLTAKMFEQTTPLGSALDKLRDKILVLSTFNFLYKSYQFFESQSVQLIIFLVMMIAVVEIFLFTVGALLSLTGAKIRANKFGRWKMGFECGAVISWALFHDLRTLSLGINDTLPLAMVLFSLFVSFGLAIASAHGQIRDNWPLIKKVASIIRNSY